MGQKVGREGRADADGGEAQGGRHALGFEDDGRRDVYLLAEIKEGLPHLLAGTDDDEGLLGEP